MKIQTIKLPAGCTEVKEEEKGSLDGGSALPTAVKAVIAVGGFVRMTYDAKKRQDPAASK